MNGLLGFGVARISHSIAAAGGILIIVRGIYLINFLKTPKPKLTLPIASIAAA